MTVLAFEPPTGKDDRFRAACANPYCPWSYRHERKELAYAHARGHQFGSFHPVVVMAADGKILASLPPRTE